MRAIVIRISRFGLLSAFGSRRSEFIGPHTTLAKSVPDLDTERA